MKTIKDVIANYKAELEKLKNEKETDFEMVLNSDWDDIDNDIQIIYCGDNPGTNEKKEGKYFAGKAGTVLADFIVANNERLGLDVDEKKIAFFNKTPCYSQKTKDIIEKKDTNKFVYDSIRLTIECLFNIYQIKKIPIYIFGIDCESYTVSSFKKILDEEKYKDFRRNLIILNHPSHKSLYAAFGEYLNKQFNTNEQVQITYSKLIEGANKNWWLVKEGDEKK